MADAETEELSPLEKLPAELRNRIYALVVVDQKHLDLSCAGRQPALAATKSTIRKDVLPIFYGENIFMVDISDFGSLTSTAELDRFVEEYKKFTKSMKRVGAYDPSPPMPYNYAKLHVLVKTDDTVEMTFHDVNSSSPACTCSIMKVVSQKHDVDDLDTLPGQLLKACVTDSTAPWIL